MMVNAAALVIRVDSLRGRWGFLRTGRTVGPKEEAGEIRNLE